MPQGEEFWNPYRMIPMRPGPIERQAPLTDEKFQGQSGILSCSLQNLTPLFIGGNRYFKENFLTRDGQCVIPGSSLKGMLRSLAEIVGGGCMITDVKGRFNTAYAACQKADQLCIACRMFGMMERGSNARVHKGNVSVGDALPVQEEPRFIKFQVLMSGCGTRHEPFYRTPNTGRLDGQSRKLYFHQPQQTETVPSVPQNLQPRAWHINALAPGQQFKFEVQFSNLTDQELALLVYVLALEDNVSESIQTGEQTLNGPLRHKIGNAKPLGLGSCHIKISQLICFAEPTQRFATLAQSFDQMFQAERLQAQITEMTHAYVNDGSDAMRQLRKMLIWDENDNRVFHYPPYDWFKNPTNSGKILKQI